MILKKPYAFLIKHFKLIHFILFVLLCVIFSYCMNIFGFFNSYVANGYKAVSTFNLTATYTPFLFLLSILSSIVISVSLYILLSYKKKTDTLYGFMIVYYVILLALFIYINGVFNTLSNELISATLSRIIRDVTIIYSIIQIPFILVVLIRSVGFNIKQFSFESDLKELDLSYKDAEEVEVGFDINSYKYKRKIRKSFREFKYYIVENKFIVSIIGVILLIIIGYTLYNTINPSFNRRYSIGNSFIYNNYEITIEDALFTRLDYKGDIISSDKYYMVLKTKVLNRLETANSFDVNTIKLITKNGIKSPTQYLATKFSDFTRAENNSFILAKDSTIFAIVYELSKEDINISYQAIISDGITTYRNQIYNKSIYVDIPINERDWQDSSKYNIGDQVDFKEDFLKDNSIVINKFNIKKTVKYSYNHCVDEKCSTLVDIISVSPLHGREDNYLLNIIGTYNNSSNNTKYSSFNAIINTFAKVEYIINNEKKSADIINVTPQNYTEGSILEVPNEMYNAEHINLIINTRFNRYIINLK